MDIAEAYDRLPYPSKYFNLTNPDHLYSVASLLGVDAAKPDNCSVLELGCGNGSNLIAHAYNLKDARFVGLDISQRHIVAANDLAEKLGLENTTFQCMDVKDLTDADFGKFDYIIAHGLISWIPIGIRERIFDIYAELLEPNGIGYVSYNAYPGAYHRQMIRDIFRYHTRGKTDPMEKVQDSIGFLAMLSEHSVDQKIHKPIFAHEFERHFRHEISDIFHDDLADDYHPLHFYEFAEILDRRDLQFVSEAEFYAMSFGQFPEEVREFVSGIDDLVAREQYLDFFRGRVFRQSLFCRKGIEIEREPDQSVLDRYFLASSMKPEQPNPDLGPGKVVHFKGNRGQGIQIDHPLTKAAISVLGETWGKAVGVPQLLQAAREKLEKAGIALGDRLAEEATARTILLKILEGTDLIDIHSLALEAQQTPGDKPVLNRLARWQLETAKNVTSLLGLNVGVRDEVSAELLRLADGTRDRDALLAGVNAFIESSGDELDREDLPEDMAAWLDGSLEELARLGTFEA
jgi:SAM-dependent methyltransferase